MLCFDKAEQRAPRSRDESTEQRQGNAKQLYDPYSKYQSQV